MVNGEFRHFARSGGEFFLTEHCGIWAFSTRCFPHCFPHAEIGFAQLRQFIFHIILRMWKTKCCMRKTKCHTWKKKCHMRKTKCCMRKMKCHMQKMKHMDRFIDSCS